MEDEERVLEIDANLLEDLFEYRYGSLITEMHYKLNEMCYGMPLYDLSVCSYELMQFCKGYSSAMDDIEEELMEELDDYEGSSDVSTEDF